MRALCALAAISLSIGCRAPSQGNVSSDSPVAAMSAPTAATPGEKLDELDSRRPVPLLPMMAQHQKQNMREHLEVVRDVVAAAATKDFVKVATAAKRMGFSETMGQMCEHMGAAAPGFTEQALAFHQTADEIVSAATQQDSAAVLSALSKTLSACTSCHATFKQKVVATLPE